MINGTRITQARIDCVRVSPQTIWTFVRVATDDGRVGVGEASASKYYRDVKKAADLWLQGIVGIEPSVEDLRAVAPKKKSFGDAALLSGIDTALHDLEGQRRGQPIHHLLGGVQRDTISIYANINLRTTQRSPSAFATSARLAIERGYDTVKIAPFDEISPAVCGDDGFAGFLELGIERLAASREAIGSNRQLRVDCHWRFDRRGAERMIDACAAFGVDWIECPIIETTDTIEEIYALRRHANKFGMRLAGLEKATSLDAFAPFLSAGAYDVIMPDVKYLGGLALFAELAEMAQRQGAAISPHNPSGPVSHAASIHVSAVVSGFDSLEHQFDETPHFNKLVGDSGVPTQEGKARLPSKPGLGVSLDEGLLDRLRLEEPSGVRNAP